MLIIKKGAFDSRTMFTYFSSLITERTEEGDRLNVQIRYKADSRPDLTFEFGTSKKSDEDEHLDVTDWLPELPYQKLIDTEGKPIGDPSEIRGFETWPQFFTASNGFNKWLTTYCKARLVRITIEEVK